MLQRFVKKWLKLLRSTLHYEYFDSEGLLNIDSADNNSNITSKKSSLNIR